jgi:hypothetical protein
MKTRNCLDERLDSPENGWLDTQLKVILVRRWLLKKKTPEITFKNFPKPTESNND